MKEETTTNTMEIQRIIRNSYEEYTLTNWNKEEMDKFLETNNLSRVNQEKN